MLCAFELPGRLPRAYQPSLGRYRLRQLIQELASQAKGCGRSTEALAGRTVTAAAVAVAVLPLSLWLPATL